ncbi:hypothetical protein H0H92_004568 [Tricholoma furcatifolium]|nr:hypothetical protein H0H92_004568 [Tricholoma furcatifolium]
MIATSVSSDEFKYWWSRTDQDEYVSHWGSSIEEDKSDDEDFPRSDSSTSNEYGDGIQSKIAQSPPTTCEFCDIDCAQMIEILIPIWRLQATQPRAEGFIWKDSSMYTHDSDGLRHICLSCYKRVLELRLVPPDWDKGSEESWKDETAEDCQDPPLEGVIQTEYDCEEAFSWEGHWEVLLMVRKGGY